MSLKEKVRNAYYEILEGRTDGVDIDSKSNSVRKYVSDFNYLTKNKFHVTKSEDGFIITRDKKKDDFGIRATVESAARNAIDGGEPVLVSSRIASTSKIRYYINELNAAGGNFRVKKSELGTMIRDNSDWGIIPRRLVAISRKREITAGEHAEARVLMTELDGLLFGRIEKEGATR